MRPQEAQIGCHVFPPSSEAMEGWRKVGFIHFTPSMNCSWPAIAFCCEVNVRIRGYVQLGDFAEECRGRYCRAAINERREIKGIGRNQIIRSSESELLRLRNESVVDKQSPLQSVWPTGCHLRKVGPDSKAVVISSVDGHSQHGQIVHENLARNSGIPGMWWYA